MSESGDRLSHLYEVGFDTPRADLSDGMRALVGLLYVDGAVTNGGFALLMDGDPREGQRRLRDAIFGADLFGRPDIREVLLAFDEQGPATAAGRAWRTREQAGQEHPLEIASTLEQLEDQYHTLPPIRTAVDQYVDAHPAEFAVAAATPPPPPPVRPGTAEFFGACPELMNDSAILEGHIEALAAVALSAELAARSPADARQLARSHMLTWIVNAAEADATVTIDEIRAGWHQTIRALSA